MRTPSESFDRAAGAGAGAASVPELAAPAAGVPLDTLPAGRPARIAAVDPAAAGQPAERARQLADLGFVPGELVAVLERAWPGGDPLVVRVGQSRFALRRAEAACVRVREPT